MVSTNSHAPKRVAFSIRVSTKHQADGGTPEVQLTELTDLAERKGWTVVEVVEDTAPRESYVRPGFDRLRDLAEARLIDEVWAWKRDRYSDDPAVRRYLDMMLQPFGVPLRAMNDSGGDTPEDEFMGTTLDAAAKVVRMRNAQGMTGASRRTRRNRTGTRQARGRLATGSDCGRQVRPSQSCP